MHETILTTSTLKRLPAPTSDPSLALARAAHLVFEVSGLGILNGEQCFNGWAAEVARAQMRVLDRLWSDELDILATKARFGLPGWQRFRAEGNAMSAAALSGYSDILHRTFAQLEILAEKVSGLGTDDPGVLLAAMVVSGPLPSFCGEWRDALVEAAFTRGRRFSPDFRFNIARVEFRVLDQRWVTVDVLASRTLLGAQDVHAWISAGCLQVKMDGSKKTVCLGEICSMTGARWLLPEDRRRPSHKVPLRNGRLVFSLEGPPAIIDRDSGVVQPPNIEDEADIVGYAIWVSRTAPFNPRVQGESENWGRKQTGGTVDVKSLLKETLLDPAGNPILYRSLSVVVRRRESGAGGILARS